MEPIEPASFYTGLVAELYSTLRSEDPDPEPYARWIARTGEPALELGCGDGDPLLDLRQRGLQVEGLDSAADMLDRCRARAARLGVEVTLHHSTIEAMDLGRTYPSIYLAGATFNLITDDETARQALGRIRVHLAPGGSALIPLFIPEVLTDDQLGRPAEHTTQDGTVLRCTPLACTRDEHARRQTTVMRYERIGAEQPAQLDREWVLHWHTQDGFRRLAGDAGLRVLAVLDRGGRPATDAAQQFSFIVSAG